MTQFIATVEEATPERLTAILREAGALERGAVASVEHVANPAFNSATTHLRLTYSAEAPASAPRRLLLKRNGPEPWAMEAGAWEAAFYSLVMPVAGDLPMVPRCYAAGHDARTGNSFVLLHDLSETHAPPVSRDQIISLDGVPAPAHLAQVVDALAAFHAYWWEHPAFGHGPAGMDDLRGVWPARADYDRYVERRQAQWASFIGKEGGWFPAGLRALYERALAGLPRLWPRHFERRAATFANLTLTHGDCYFCNFLCPRGAMSGATYLIDFQGVEPHFGAMDLVFLFAAFWTPEQRHAEDREQAMLRRYHRGLLAHGVAGYSWDDLLTDYQLMVLDRIFLPVWDQTNGSPHDYWWPKIQCLTSAYQDLGCAQLLD
jgi:hypothetical protein